VLLPVICNFEDSGWADADRSRYRQVAWKATLQLRLIFLGFVSITIPGCQTISGEPERLYSAAEEADSTRSLLSRIEQSYYDSSSDAERKSWRNEYIGRRMYYTDLQFTDFQTALTRERQQFGFTSALAAQGLSAAGAVVTPVNTVRILSALTGGVNASRGFYDSELLTNRAIQIVESQMQSNRDNVSTIILSRLNESAVTYPLSFALTDLEDYYRAGTMTSGLIKAAAEAAINAHESEDLKYAAIRQEVQNSVITDVNKPLEKQHDGEALNSSGLTKEEINLGPGKIAQINTVLCIPQGQKITPETRKALPEFFGAVGLTATSKITSNLQLNTLRSAFYMLKRLGGTCKAAQLADASAVGRALVSGK
jgi:hypothetical protein